MQCVTDTRCVTTHMRMQHAACRHRDCRSPASHRVPPPEALLVRMLEQYFYSLSVLKLFTTSSAHVSATAAPVGASVVKRASAERVEIKIKV
jgi:hypothetical protein